jgi:hypothetical protein
MLKYEGIGRLLASLQPGDRVLLEYGSLEGVEALLWGKLIPELIRESTVLAVDIYGVGDMLFRNYIRGAKISEYKSLIHAKKRIYVFKLGSGNPSYGLLVGDDKLYTKADDFLKTYHWMIRKALNLPEKPKFLVVFGVSEFFLFHERNALKNVLQATTAIPVEDWVTFIPLNISAVDRELTAVLEELSTHVVLLEGGELKLLKGRAEE